MKKVFAIAKWEFLEKVKNRLFMATLFIAPILIISISGIAGFFTESNLNYTKVVAVQTENQTYFNLISSELEKITETESQPSFFSIRLKSYDKQNSEFYDAVVIINEIDNSFNIDIHYALTLSPIELTKIKGIVESSILKGKLIFEEDNTQFPSFSFSQKSLDENNVNEKNFHQFFMSSFAFLFLLIVVIIFSGSTFIRALLEEKSTHINEILLSSVSAKEILFGKYLGLIFIGLVQTIFWFGISYLVLTKTSISFHNEINYYLLIIYFLLGYLVYTSIFLAIGSQVSSENESQQITTLVSLFLIVPIVLSVQILIAPTSLLSNILTYFPLTTSPIMLIKLNLIDISISEILLTIIIQLCAIFIIISLASKFFAHGFAQLEKKKRN